MKIETGYHDATACKHDSVAGDVWLSWCKVDGKFADTETHTNAADAAAWCDAQKKARGAQ